jgi:hypothetical protein
VERVSAQQKASGHLFEPGTQLIIKKSYGRVCPVEAKRVIFSLFFAALSEGLRTPSENFCFFFFKKKKINKLSELFR